MAVSCKKRTSRNRLHCDRRKTTLMSGKYDACLNGFACQRRRKKVTELELHQSRWRSGCGRRPELYKEGRGEIGRSCCRTHKRVLELTCNELWRRPEGSLVAKHGEGSGCCFRQWEGDDEEVDLRGSGGCWSLINWGSPVETATL